MTLVGYKEYLTLIQTLLAKHDYITNYLRDSSSKLSDFSSKITAWLKKNQSETSKLFHEFLKTKSNIT